MKSAYELAMERLAKSDPEHAPRALSESEKRELADIDSRYQAKLAGRELFLKGKLEEVRAQGNWQEEESLLKQLASERKVILEEMEDQKNAVRNRQS
ncbi:MAG: hypothetical protein JW706_08520 [Opitutales bacterium]|nr:hypothetical protein [Opitutales bacterium]MDD4348697.1 hypothetical protein [Opitutales bacterium]